MRILLFLPACLLLLHTMLPAQPLNKNNLVYMDKQGVLRYTASKQEASFFGVNYTTPFAHAYRAQKAKGINLEQAIRNDVYHFSRLGLNAFRVHVWDTEISDTTGNLLNNEHLRLFDFLLAELKKAKIRTIITPIAFWGNGYPDPDEPTPGFSRYYGRGKLTTDENAIRAQENYLKQFFTHVNPYTKLRYQNDPDIIAVEINNEPAHSGPKEGVTQYINRLAAAIRQTGWSKPLFYNIAQGPGYSDAVAASTVDGFSFQWYPTGLVGNRTLPGNSLPAVDQYRIPFRDTVPAFARRALMVYEFDAADVMAPYMYPAMARSFRSAGFQWATQFAYDPMGIADVNSDYQTHYLNLAYTPAKAISLMIAAEVFHRVPRGKQYGVYPADTSFNAFHLSYQQALSEMNTDNRFYYSNNTRTRPRSLSSLQHLAGVHNSPVVQYEGAGAYFLDKLSPHAWRLELMPDAVPLRDPFRQPEPGRPATAIAWKKHDMVISLPGLNADFSVQGINKGNDFRGSAREGKITLSPGTYLLLQKGARQQMPSGTFVAPPASLVDFQLVEKAGDTAVPATAGISLYNPATDTYPAICPDWRTGFEARPVAEGAKFRLSITDMQPEEVMGLQYYIGDKLAAAGTDSEKGTLLIKAAGAEKLVLRITLVDSRGQGYSKLF
ncbi:MAG: cellulase family glycosylhydrolase, partial [Flavihumibacter sp.]